MMSHESLRAAKGVNTNCADIFVKFVQFVAKENGFRLIPIESLVLPLRARHIVSGAFLVPSSPVG